MPTIRPITESDIAGFRDAVDAVARERLYLSMLEGVSLEDAGRFVRSNIANNNPQWVAVTDTDVVGWCDIVRSDNPRESHVGTMGMGLLPPWREQGLGRQLLAAVLDHAAAIGITRIELSVHAGNTRAIRLYERLGFGHEGRLRAARRIDGAYQDILLMARLDPVLLGSAQ